MKHCVSLLILNCLTLQISGVLEWTVVRKVTDYGQNVTLFCNVSNCCPKYSGWDMWTPKQRTLFIDVKTGRGNKKYDGKVTKDGYTLVIQNLTKQDLNVSYSCLYGVTFGERKFLLEEDVFTYISTTEANGSISNRRSTEAEMAALITGVIVAVSVSGILSIYFLRRRKKRKGKSDTDENFALMDKDNLQEMMNDVGEILKDTDRKAYMEAMNCGKEIRKYVRIHVIGKSRSGKTCLIRRLLGQGIDDVESTDGIDIVKSCQIKTSDGEWTYGNVERKERIRRILKAVDSNFKGKDSASCEPIQPNAKLDKDMLTSSNLDNTKSDTYDMNEENPCMNTDIEENLKYSKEIHDSPDLTSENQSHVYSDKDLTRKLNEITDDILLDVKNESSKPTEDDLVECGIWDFSGQKEYFGTHQLFLTPHAIYLLVFDIDDEFKSINDNGNDDFDYIGENFDFWFDNIHCFCKELLAEKICPPVIMVCTGIDKVPKGELTVKQREYEMKFLEMFGPLQTKYNHRRGCIRFISNKIPLAKDIASLKNDISQIAREMEYCAETLPTSLINLENALDVLRESKERFISKQNMMVLTQRYITITEDDLLLFLNYQHKIGNILFFEDIPEYIILQPDWLVSCFRCLVCDERKKYWDLNFCNDKIQLDHKGKLSDSLMTELFQKQPDLKFGQHIRKVMETFKIIVQPQFEEAVNTSYYMPSVIKTTTTLAEIIEKNPELMGSCRTPWLVLEFKFLPIAYLNSIMCNYISKYRVFQLKSGDPAIFKGTAVVYIDKERLQWLIIRISKNAISLQICSYEQKIVEHESILTEICSLIEKLKGQFMQNLLYEIKAKCNTGNCNSSLGRISHKEMTPKKALYFCTDHGKTHNKREIENSWFKQPDRFNALPNEETLTE